MAKTHKDFYTIFIPVLRKTNISIFKQEHIFCPSGCRIPDGAFFPRAAGSGNADEKHEDKARTSFSSPRVRRLAAHRKPVCRKRREQSCVRQHGEPQRPGHRRGFMLSSPRPHDGIKASKIIVCPQQGGMDSMGCWSPPAMRRHKCFGGQIKAVPQFTHFPVDCGLYGLPGKHQQLPPAL